MTNEEMPEGKHIIIPIEDIDSDVLEVHFSIDTGGPENVQYILETIHTAEIQKRDEALRLALELIEKALDDESNPDANWCDVYAARDVLRINTILGESDE